MSLAGQRVLVTRAEGQASVLADRLRELGAVPWVLPAIEVVAPTDPAPLRRAVAASASFDWIVFTSGNSARAFATTLRDLKLNVPSSVRFGAVGPATAGVVEELLGRPSVLPTVYRSDMLIEVLGEIEGRAFLLPRGDLARDELERALTAAGAGRVVAVEAYRTVAAAWPAVIEGRPDLITFTSSSGVLATHERLAERGLLDWLTSIPCVCIGPMTAATLEDVGGVVAEVADQHTIPGLIEAVLRASPLAASLRS